MNRLLVPVDFSSNAADALRYAHGLAHHAGYSIDCLHVTKISTRSHFLSPDQLTELERSAREKAFVDLEAFLKETLPNEGSPVETRPVVRFGFAIEEIIAQASGLDYTAVVMGTKGTENLSEKILGSNTANVMENVPLPVISVPAGARFQPVDVLTYVCDIEAVNLPCIGRLFALSQRIAGTLRLLHIDELGAYRRPGAREQLESLVRMAIGNIQVEVTVFEADSILEGVVSYLTSHPDELIAISLVDQGGFRKLFRRSIDEDLRQRLHIPILTLKA